MNLNTEVILFDVHNEDDATEVWSGTVEEFLSGNRDWIDGDEEIRITTALATRKRVLFGGGAEPVTALRIAAEVVGAAEGLCLDTITNDETGETATCELTPGHNGRRHSYASINWSAGDDAEVVR